MSDQVAAAREAARAADGRFGEQRHGDPGVDVLDGDSGGDAAWRVYGFTQEAAERWYACGFNAFRAAPWRRAGFTPDDAKLWRSYGFIARTARMWRAAGFSAPVAASYVNAGFSTDQAGDWHSSGQPVPPPPPGDLPPAGDGGPAEMTEQDLFWAAPPEPIPGGYTPPF